MQHKVNDADEHSEFVGKLANNDIIFDNVRNVKSKRQSIKFKCKNVVEKPTKRSTRTVRKNYTEEEVLDDDHYICKFPKCFSSVKTTMH